MQDSKFEVLQVCRNGHIVNDYGKSSPEYNQDYCPDCGEPTITDCPECGSPIRGGLLAQYYGGLAPMPMDKPPAHCASCGKGYPWTESRLEAARELADELEGLQPDERDQLKESFPDLMRDTPKTALAETRFKRLMKKAGADAYEGMRSILVDVVSEAVRKSIFGP